MITLIKGQQTNIITRVKSIIFIFLVIMQDVRTREAGNLREHLRILPIAHPPTPIYTCLSTQPGFGTQVNSMRTEM